MVGVAPEAPAGSVLAGRVAGLFGVDGWIKVYSFTEPRENIVDYDPWLLPVHGEWREFGIESGRTHGKGVVAKLEGIPDRDTAMGLQGLDIAVKRDQFAALPEGGYYWADLIGLEVVTLDGRRLGKVSRLYETGANAVLSVSGDRERLLPFVYDQVIHEVDLDAGTIRVEWDPAF